MATKSKGGGKVGRNAKKPTRMKWKSQNADAIAIRTRQILKAETAREN